MTPRVYYKKLILGIVNDKYMSPIEKWENIKCIIEFGVYGYDESCPQDILDDIHGNKPKEYATFY